MSLMHLDSVKWILNFYGSGGRRGIKLDFSLRLSTCLAVDCGKRTHAASTCPRVCVSHTRMRARMWEGVRRSAPQEGEVGPASGPRFCKSVLFQGHSSSF